MAANPDTRIDDLIGQLGDTLDDFGVAPPVKTAVGTDYAPYGNESFLVFSYSTYIYNQIISRLEKKGFRRYDEETRAQEVRLKNKFDCLQVFKKGKIFIYAASTDIISAAMEYFSRVMETTPFKRIIIDKETEHCRYVEELFKKTFGLEFVEMSNSRYLGYFS